MMRPVFDPRTEAGPGIGSQLALDLKPYPYPLRVLDDRPMLLVYVTRDEPRDLSKGCGPLPQ